MIKIIEDVNEKERIATSILGDLEEWFGLPECTKEYIENGKNMPFIAYIHDERYVGFIVLKETSKYTCEVYVMGVLQEYHKQGIGTMLWQAFEKYAAKKGYEYVQVKTVKSGQYEIYDRTNAFYKKLGFRELEVFPTLWDEWNPCQVYVKNIITGE